MKAPNNTTFTVQDVSDNRYDSATHSIINNTYTYEYKYNVLSALTFKYRIYCWCQCVPQYTGKEDSGYLECIPSTTIGVSALSANSANIGQTIRITINKMDDSYVDNLYYTVNGTKTLIAENVSSPYDWVIPPTFYSLLGATARSLPVRLSVETLSNGVNLGADIADINAYAVEAECNPQISPVFTILNAQPELTGNANVGIVNFNGVEVAVNPTARYNATIASISVKHGGITNATATSTFEKLYNDNFIITVVDSRGFSISATKSIPLVNWFKPSFSFTATSPDATTNHSDIKVEGTFFSSSFGAVNNILNVDCRWKTGSGEYSEWQAMAVETNANAFAATYTATLDYAKQWIIQIRVIDKLTTQEGKEIIVITLPVFDWSESDFNFNVPIYVNNKYLLVPTGGSAGQYLVKKSDTDYDTKWQTLPTIPTITSGTNAPSGGSNGDIYFQYT